jgi:dolichol-phosphate mannosyltransferase
MRALVVLPTYNEADNIERLLREILSLSPELSVCVVDDSSPDGTHEVVRHFHASLPPDEARRIHRILRSHKDGRGGAVRAGIEWGLGSEDSVEAFVEMDCDFSHPPGEIPHGLEILREADVVMGSRYPDGKIVGWPWHRRAFSFLANLLARTLISWSVADYTNGFRFYTRRAAELMCSFPQRRKGYIYLSETIAHFLEAGYRLRSFPIVFVNRVRGKSNTSLREVAGAFFGIIAIAWRYWRHHGCKAQGAHWSHG